MIISNGKGIICLSEQNKAVSKDSPIEEIGPIPCRNVFLRQLLREFFQYFFFFNGLAFSKYLTKSFRGQLQVVRKLEVTVKAEPFKVSPQL